MKPQRKPIQIDNNLHAELKKYCNERGLILSLLVERLIKSKLKEDGNSISAQENGH